MGPNYKKRKATEATAPVTPETSPRKLPTVSPISRSPAGAPAPSPVHERAAGRLAPPPSPLASPPMGTMTCVVVVTSRAIVAVEASKDRAATGPASTLRFNAEDGAGTFGMFRLEFPNEGAAAAAAATAAAGATLRITGIRSVHTKEKHMKERMPRYFLAVGRKPAGLAAFEGPRIEPVERTVLVKGQDLLGGNILAADAKGHVTVMLLVTSASAPFALDGVQARDVEGLTSDGSTLSVTLIGRHARIALLQREQNLRPLLLLENATIDNERRVIAVDYTSATCNDLERWPVALAALMKDLPEASAPGGLDITVSDIDIIRDATRAIGWLAAREAPCPLVSDSMVIQSCGSAPPPPPAPTSDLVHCTQLN